MLYWYRTEMREKKLGEEKPLQGYHFELNLHSCFKNIKMQLKPDRKSHRSHRLWTSSSPPSGRPWRRPCLVWSSQTGWRLLSGRRLSAGQRRTSRAASPVTWGMRPPSPPWRRVSSDWSKTKKRSGRRGGSSERRPSWRRGTRRKRRTREWWRRAFCAGKFGSLFLEKLEMLSSHSHKKNLITEARPPEKKAKIQSCQNSSTTQWEKWNIFVSFSLE